MIEGVPDSLALRSPIVDTDALPLAFHLQADWFVNTLASRTRASLSREHARAGGARQLQDSRAEPNLITTGLPQSLRLGPWRLRWGKYNLLSDHPTRLQRSRQRHFDCYMVILITNSNKNHVLGAAHKICCTAHRCCNAKQPYGE